MPRPPRIEFEGALYHIFSRGNNRQPLFVADEDRRLFLRIMEAERAGLDFTVYAFCLLTSHFHLLLQTRKAGLSKVMHNTLARYARAFNRRYQAEGHLFQGRYHALLCERDTYFLTLTRYIHLNPLRAGLCRRPEDYPWSSLRAYLNLPHSWPLQVEGGLALQMLGGMDAYRKYLREETESASRPWEPDPGSNVLGSREFVEGVLDRLGARGWSANRLDGLRKRFARVEHLSLQSLLTRVCEHYHVPLHELSEGSRVRDAAKVRAVIAYLAKERLGLDLSLLERELGATKSALYRTARWIQRDPRLRREADSFLQ